MTSKSLDLKVTVTTAPNADPDAALARMDKDKLRLTASPYSLKVTKIERADGLPFGLEAGFEEWWAESHLIENGDDPGYESHEKAWAREAFAYGVQFMKNRSKA